MAKPPPSRLRRVMFVLVVVLPTLFLCGMCGLGAFNIVAGYSLGRSPLFAHFQPTAISMLSADEGWVVGWPAYFKLDRPLPSHRQPLVLAQAHPIPADEEHVALRRHHGVWSRVTLPDSFDAVQTLAEDDAWALSGGSGIYHWDGTRWSFAIMRSSTLSASHKYGLGFGGLGLGGLTMLNADEGWAVGDNGIWHYTGGVWSDVTSLAKGISPDPNERIDVRLRAVSFATPRDGWAVGIRDIWHYDGTAWHIAKLPVDVSAALAHTGLSAIQMLSPTEGWAIGTQDSYTDHPTGIVLHYANGAWSVAYTLPKAQFSAIAMLSEDDGWIGGQAPGDSSFLGLNPHSSSIVRYHDGTWTPITIPASGVQSLSMDAPDDGWAVAGDELLHYHNGVWSVALA